MKIVTIVYIGLSLCFFSIARAIVLNNPYDTADQKGKVFYSAFAIPPETLDPAKSYAGTDWLFMGNVYESLYQYHYLKRPYELIPATAATLPTITYFDAHQKPLPLDAPIDKIANTSYRIVLKSGIHYQPHPAFAKNNEGGYRYHQLTFYDALLKKTPFDFEHLATREITAEDIAYQIKRLADPVNASPVYGFLENRIMGFKDFSQKVAQLRKQKKEDWLDLRTIPLAGVEIIDRYTLTIKVQGKFQPFVYWLAMPFFSPIPWEADKFYAQPLLKKKNIGWGKFPVGTNAYMVTENNPNKRILLEKNPNFHHETYPNTGEPGDREKGLLDNAGKTLPLIERFNFSLEKETIPRWNKFLQGYYDRSVISEDNFQQVVQLTENGPQVTKVMQDKKIRLTSETDMSVFFMAFNMMDPIVGGYSEPARKLRRAITIAINQEEMIDLFRNGRGVAAQDPIPPGLFGKRIGKMGINPYVYEWSGEPKRKSIAIAKKLLAEAGYPNGINPKTGNPLTLTYETITIGSNEKNSTFEWYRRQFSAIGIRLNIEPINMSLYEQHTKNGDIQLFDAGWGADYPDPENFLFLFYSKNGKIKYDGENRMNYENAEYDALFEQMRNMPNTPLREQIIRRMIDLLQKDNPCTMGFYSETFMLTHHWVKPTKLTDIGTNIFKYYDIDVGMREQYWQQYNHAVFWPLILILISFLLLFIPAVITYRNQQNQPALRE